MLLPAVLVIIVLFLVPLIYSVLLSFNFFSVTSDTTVGLQAYWAILTSQSFTASFVFSLKIAIISTLISIVIAIAISMMLRRTFFGKKLALYVYQFNIPVPHYVVGLSVLLLLSQTGLVSRWFYFMGLISSPSSFPMIIFGQNGVGIIITYVLKFFPFIGISVLSILLTTVGDYEQQAATLGANGRQRFFNILLPMMMPSILFSSILVFAYAFGSYEVPLLLGSTYPEALSVLAYQMFTSIDLNTRPEALAIASIITLVTVVLMVIAYMQLNKMNKMAVKKDV